MRTPRARKRCFQVEMLEQRNLLSQGGGLLLIITTPTGGFNVGRQVAVVSSNALHGLTQAQNNGVVSFGQIGWSPGNTTIVSPSGTGVLTGVLVGGGLG